MGDLGLELLNGLQQRWFLSVLTAVVVIFIEDFIIQLRSILKPPTREFHDPPYCQKQCTLDWVEIREVATGWMYCVRLLVEVLAESQILFLCRLLRRIQLRQHHGWGWLAFRQCQAFSQLRWPKARAPEPPFFLTPRQVLGHAVTKDQTVDSHFVGSLILWHLAKCIQRPERTLPPPFENSRETIAVCCS